MVIAWYDISQGDSQITPYHVTVVGFMHNRQEAAPEFRQQFVMSIMTQLRMCKTQYHNVMCIKTG